MVMVIMELQQVTLLALVSHLDQLEAVLPLVILGRLFLVVEVMAFILEVKFSYLLEQKVVLVLWLVADLCQVKLMELVSEPQFPLKLLIQELS